MQALWAVLAGVAFVLGLGLGLGRLQEAWLAWWLLGERQGRWAQRPLLRAVLHALRPRAASTHASAAYRAYLRGDMELARLLLEPCPLEALADTFQWNQVLCVLVAAGRYREALAPARRTWRDDHEVQDGIMRINEAEALACLGRLEDSLAHVAVVTPGAGMGALRGGVAGHRAWVLAALGRPVEARAALERAKLGDVPADYRSEFHFAGAFVALAEHDVSGARREVLAGVAAARRSSSSRNGLFLQARMASLEGRDEEALRLYAEGAAHGFTGQGGDALLAWGDLLAAKGDGVGAMQAWRLCTERDPESPAADVARQRLAATRGPQPAH